VLPVAVGVPGPEAKDGVCEKILLRPKEAAGAAAAPAPKDNGDAAVVVAGDATPNPEVGPPVCEKVLLLPKEAAGAAAAPAPKENEDAAVVVAGDATPNPEVVPLVNGIVPNS